MTRHHTTVTRDGWSVAFITGTDIDGCRLSAHRTLRDGTILDAAGNFNTGPDRLMTLRGEGDGRLFPTKDEAAAFALDHGYLQTSRTGWCRRCRKLHVYTLGARTFKTGFCSEHKEFTG